MDQGCKSPSQFCAKMCSSERKEEYLIQFIFDGLNGLMWCDAHSLLILVATCQTLKKRSESIAQKRKEVLLLTSNWAQRINTDETSPVLGLVITETLKQLEQVLPARTNIQSLVTVRCALVDIAIPEMALFIGGSRKSLLNILKSQKLNQIGKIFFRGMSVTANSAADFGLALASADVKCAFIQGAELGDTGAIAFASKFLSSNRNKLRILALQNCGIGPMGFARLGLAIQATTSLVAIDISGNHLGSGSNATAFFRQLASAASLRGIELSANSIDDNGARCAADLFIKNSTTIEFLSLASNFITEIGGQALAHAISPSTSLRFLELKRNRRLKTRALHSISDVRLQTGGWPLVDILPETIIHNRNPPDFNRLSKIWWSRSVYGF
uniref:Uncharacterized protein n=1 Tax=Aureoumbra lagunensis TaxID=44058 RepID=A0A7S3NNH1_9STRA